MSIKRGDKKILQNSQFVAEILKTKNTANKLIVFFLQTCFPALGPFLTGLWKQIVIVLQPYIQNFDANVLVSSDICLIRKLKSYFDNDNDNVGCH